METTITINSHELPIKEFKGQRVITFKDIDAAHERASGTAHRNFKANRERFIEGTDYFRRNSSEAKDEYGITAPSGLILITETGYLMLVKSFTDDLAWKVQRELVNSYFRVKPAPAPVPEPSPRFYPEKATSVGEIASLIKLLRDIMKAQRSPDIDIAMMTKDICEQFGIKITYRFINWKAEEERLKNLSLRR